MRSTSIRAPANSRTCSGRSRKIHDNCLVSALGGSGPTIGAVVSESAAALLAVRRVERTPDNGRGGGFGRFGDDGIAGHAHAVSRFVRHGRLPSGLGLTIVDAVLVQAVIASRGGKAGSRLEQRFSRPPFPRAGSSDRRNLKMKVRPSTQKRIEIARAFVARQLPMSRTCWHRTGRLARV